MWTTWLFAITLHIGGGCSSSARFKGEVAEPRSSLPSGGGMKGALKLHYSKLLDPEQGTVKPKTELAKGDSLYMYVHVGYVHHNIMMVGGLHTTIGPNNSQ